MRLYLIDPATMDEEDRLPGQNPMFGPIGMAMRVPGGAAPPPQPAGPMAQPIAPGAPAGSAMTLPPVSMPTPQKSALETLASKAGGIHNPFARLLAETGTGLLRGADAAAESILPGPAMLIPGSTLGTAAKNNRAMKTAETENTEQTEREKANAATTQADTEQQKEKFGEEQAKNTVTIAGPNGTPIQVPVKVWEDLQKNQNTNQTKENTTNAKNVSDQQIAQWKNDNQLAVAGGKPQPHITTMVGGRAHVMGYNPQTKKYDQDEGIAPPNYAQAMAPARTISLLAPDGTQHVMGWNEQTQQYDRDMGVAPGKATEAAQSAQGDINYAQNYLNSGNFTGAGDEALMESFFDLAKPSSGFRMSQPQIDMLMKGRSWMDSAQGIKYHAENGVWFPPDQRRQIVDAMKMKQSAKNAAATPSGPAAANAPKTNAQQSKGAPPKVGTVEGGYRFKGGDPSKSSSWEKVSGK